MRKLKLQVQISIDGFIAGPNGEMDWMTWNWDDALKNYVNALTDSVDTILLGRKMAGGFIAHWSNVCTRPDDPGYEFAKLMIGYPKFVFTKTLNESDPEVRGWANTTLIKTDYIEAINALKNQEGKDIIVYGGATFDSSLVKAGLIDEYHLFINPAAIGKGMPIFHSLEAKQSFKLEESTSFDCGIVVSQYHPQI